MPTWRGFTYVALVIDLHPRTIVGWSTSTVKDTPFVEEALKMALWRRDHTGRPVPRGMIHHSDAGAQYTSIRYTDTLMLEGLQASIGTVGDAYDDAAAEAVMGLFKNEAIAKDSPFRTGPLKTETDVQEIVFDWVNWYNTERLHSALGNIPPEEYERNYYAETNGPSTGDAANNGGMKTGTVHFVDPSLAVAAMGASPTTLLTDVNTLGFLFESLVVRDLRVYSQSLDGVVKHYRDHAGIEVDAIVELSDGSWAAFEIKLGEGRVDEGAASLLKFATKVDTTKSGVPRALVVITTGQFAYTRKDGVHVVPHLTKYY